MTSLYGDGDSESKVSTLQAVSLILVLLVVGTVWTNWFGGAEARKVRENIEVDLETVGAGWAFHNSLDPVKNKENLTLQAVPGPKWQFNKWVWENGDTITENQKFVWEAEPNSEITAVFSPSSTD